MQKQKLRIFSSLKEYSSLFGKTFKVMMQLRNISQTDRISPQFREKLMVALSTVNKCAYCSYLHTRLALEQGISRKEIDDILKNDIKQFSKQEVPGILFAQHFAETKGNTSKTAFEKVIQAYGENKARYIRAFLHSVLFGNLCCNTYVAFKKGLITPIEKRRLRLIYILSIPVARMILKRSGSPE